jgi:hypothetical protein
MIGVLAPSADHAVVREFFELFKTPWRMHRDDLPCDVLLCANADVPTSSARLVLIFGAQQQAFDREQGLLLGPAPEMPVLLFRSERLPIYGACSIFRDAGPPILADETSGSPAAINVASGTQKIVRIGYDLFAEIRHLLTHGQPRAFAPIPTLDLHISFVRNLIISHGPPLVEIPPVPEGYDFIACLTHDVDHPRVRNHCCDHTMFGFVARALVGSLIDCVRGRGTFRAVTGSYRAVFSLPLVYLGLAPDFWNLCDRYTEIEGDARSTFFVIPEKGNPGRGARRSPARRAAKYDLSEIIDDLRGLLSAGREIAVHGIDAWHDAAPGRVELARIREVTGAKEIGVRMHWLFYGEESPARLEEAGYSYDSTMGYNDAVGYRAGTVQVFKPLQVERLLELPLHVMDTAMFYLSYMSLSPSEAKAELDGVIEKASRFGGVLTVNWHDRSIGPERFWDEIYIELVDKLKRRGAWMPTAAEAVAWFRRRRAAVIEMHSSGDAPTQVTVSLPDDSGNLSPGLRLRSYQSATPDDARLDGNAPFTDLAVTRSAHFELEAFQPASAAA